MGQSRRAETCRCRDLGRLGRLGRTLFPVLTGGTAAAELRFSKPIKWQHGRGGNHAEFEHLDETKDLACPAAKGIHRFFRLSHRREGRVLFAEWLSSKRDKPLTSQ